MCLIVRFVIVHEMYTDSDCKYTLKIKSEKRIDLLVLGV